MKWKAGEKMAKPAKKATSRGNGGVKRDRTDSRFIRRESASKAAELTERAWKKTYENRSKSKAAA
jgi:hypothetical protein